MRRTKNISFIKRTILLLAIQILFLISILAAYIMVTYQNTMDGMQGTAQSFIQLYGRNLDNKIEAADQIINQMVYDNTPYILLQSPKESDRVYASMTLRQTLEEVIASERYVDVVIVAEKNYQTFLDAETNPLGWDMKQEMKRFALDYFEEDADASWNIHVFSGTPYIYKMYAWKDRAVGVFLSIENFMETKTSDGTQDMGILFADRDDKIWSAYGQAGVSWTMGEVLPEQGKVGYLKETYDLEAGDFELQLYFSMEQFSGQLKTSRIVLLMIIIGSLLFGGLLVATIRNQILEPMSILQSNMATIQGGDYQHRIEDVYRNNEFEALKVSFNKMMDEIVGLKIAGYEKQIELQESELRNIRLQIKPHFFLNALTTISSLSLKGRNQDIGIYIDALSKNIRYMFKSGLHTVSVQEELHHIENYFEMQELKYPGSVFYFISMEPELAEWRIPQMIIHTIIENEYKYAVSVDELLSIFIKVSEVRMQDEALLCIEIEDDGQGYSPEVLADFAQESGPKDDGSHVGLWSVRKMLELMYDREGLFEISNIEPHGCMNRFLIPEKPLHEVNW